MNDERDPAKAAQKLEAIIKRTANHHHEAPETVAAMKKMAVLLRKKALKEKAQK